MGGFSAVAEKFQRDEQDEESRSVETPVSSPIVTREEIDDRRACLLTTRFERNRAHLDIIHSLQIKQLRELRSSTQHQDTSVLLQSMNCISAGLGWTG